MQSGEGGGDGGKKPATGTVPGAPAPGSLAAAIMGYGPPPAAYTPAPIAGAIATGPTMVAPAPVPSGPTPVAAPAPTPTPVSAPIPTPTPAPEPSSATPSGYAPMPAAGGYVAPQPSGYGPPPGQGYTPPPVTGYGPPPAAGHYAAPTGPTVGGYGPPPPPAGPGETAPGTAPAAAAAPKKSKRAGALKRVLILAAAGIAVLLAGVGVYAAVWYYSGASPILAKYLPKDTQAYIEVPSLTKAIVKMFGADIVDGAEIDTDKEVSSTVDAFSSSFDGLKKDDAETLIKSVQGVALGMRNLSDRDQEAVFLVSFGSVEGVDALLKSERFEKTDKVAGGQGYEIKPGDGESDKKTPLLERALDRVSVKGARNVAVWFEETKVLAIGSADMVEDCGKVMRGDKEPLSSTEHFKQAKYENGGVALGWLDADAVIDIADKRSRDGSDVKRKFFDGVGPFALTARVADAGLVLTLTGELRGKAIPDEKLVPKGRSMDLWEKLPDTTIGYISASNGSKLDPKERKELTLEFLKQLDRDSGRSADKNIDKLETALGISFDRIADALGDQMVIGVVTSDKFKVEPNLKQADLLESLGVDAIFKTNDHEAAEKLVKVLREKGFEDGPLGRLYDVDKKDDGFIATPKKDELPLVRVILREDELLVLVGQKKLIDKMIDAYEGDATLRSDGAHKLALKAMSSKPFFFGWIDTGRVMKDMLSDADDLKDSMKDMGIPYKALKMEGDDRVTTAFAVEAVPDDGGIRYRIETLNLFGFSAFGDLLFRGLVKKAPTARRVDIDEPFAPPPSAGETGNAECDAYIERIRRCPGVLGETMREGLPQLVSTLKSGVSLNPTSMTSTCKQMNDAVQNSCP